MPTARGNSSTGRWKELPGHTLSGLCRPDIDARFPPSEQVAAMREDEAQQRRADCPGISGPVLGRDPAHGSTGSAAATMRLHPFCIPLRSPGHPPGEVARHRACLPVPLEQRFGLWSTPGCTPPAAAGLVTNRQLGIVDPAGTWRRRFGSERPVKERRAGSRGTPGAHSSSYNPRELD